MAMIWLWIIWLSCTAVMLEVMSRAARRVDRP
jgi:hypothetical protein